jgi:hypothetical protein
LTFCQPSEGKEVNGEEMGGRSQGEVVRERERERGTTGLKQSNKGRIESKTSSTDLVASICRTGQEYQSPD